MNTKKNWLMVATLSMLGIALSILPAWSHAKCVWKKAKITKKKDKGCEHTTWLAVGSSHNFTMEVRAEALRCQGFHKDFRPSLVKAANRWCKETYTNKTSFNLETNIQATLHHKNILQVQITESSYTGGAHPVNKSWDALYNVKTGKKASFRSLFPDTHRHLARQLRLAFRRLPKAKRMDHHCENTEPSLAMKKGRLFVQRNCNGNSEATRNHILSVEVPAYPKASEELWPRRRTARALLKTEWKRLQALWKGKGRVVRKHSLKVNLPGYRNHFFAVVLNTLKGKTQVQFAFVRDNKVVLQLPAFRGNQWQVHDVAAVALRDLNRDGKRDILVMVDCMSGIGPQGARPFRVTSTYFADGTSFRTSKVWETMLEKKSPSNIRKVVRMTRRNRLLLKNLPPSP
ncbi:MAG: hypothetical protein EP343_33905 [Deltaproteobacteria bacterium]|nr:MAG: hypothetical protein EP343_33905 [Deltaproteobacteria bacterium]